MKLHQNRTIFQDAIKFTAQQMNTRSLGCAVIILVNG